MRCESPSATDPGRSHAPRARPALAASPMKAPRLPRSTGPEDRGGTSGPTGFGTFEHTAGSLQAHLARRFGGNRRRIFDGRRPGARLPGVAIGTGRLERIVDPTAVDTRAGLEARNGHNSRGPPPVARPSAWSGGRHAATGWRGRDVRCAARTPAASHSLTRRHGASIRGRLRVRSLDLPCPRVAPAPRSHGTRATTAAGEQAAPAGAACAAPRAPRLAPTADQTRLRRNRAGSRNCQP